MENRKETGFKFTININQKEAYLLFGTAIDFLDLIIFDFIKDYSTTEKCSKMQYKGKQYFMIRRALIMQHLPLLNINSKVGISKRLDKLCELDIIERYENNQKEAISYFCTGVNWYSLLFSNEKSPINESLQLPINENATLSTKVYSPINESLQLPINESLHNKTHNDISKIKKEEEKENPFSQNSSQNEFGLNDLEVSAEFEALGSLSNEILLFLGNNTTEKMRSNLRRKMRENGLLREDLQKQFLAYKEYIDLTGTFKHTSFASFIDAISEKDYSALLLEAKSKQRTLTAQTANETTMTKESKIKRNQNLG